MDPEDEARRQEEVEALQSIFGEPCVTSYVAKDGVRVVEVRPEVDCPWHVRAFLPPGYPSTAPATIEVDGATLPPGAYSDLVGDVCLAGGGGGRRGRGSAGGLCCLVKVVARSGAAFKCPSHCVPP